MIHPETNMLTSSVSSQYKTVAGCEKLAGQSNTSPANPNPPKITNPPDILTTKSYMVVNTIIPLISLYSTGEIDRSVK